MTPFRHRLPDGASIAGRTIGSGPPIVLLHAGPTTQEMWEPVAAELSRDRLVVTYDFRGYGDSDATAGSFSHADDLLELCAALGLERPSVVGNSLGGRVALDAAALHPERFGRLVLFAPGLGDRPARDPFTVDLETQIFEAVSRLDAEAILQLVCRNWVSGPRRPPGAPSDEMHRAVTAMLVKNLMVGAQNTGVERHVDDLIGRLGSITESVTVAIGDLDTTDIGEWAELVERTVPGASITRMSGLGHLIPIEDPVATTSLIRDALAAGDT